MNIKQLVVVGAVALLGAACSGPFGGGVPGAGVAKTTNGGTEWTFANKATLPSTAKKKVKQSDSALAGSSVFALRFAPGNTKRLYAATQTNGLFYSENAADAWSQPLKDFAAYDVAIDPTNSDRVFVVGRANAQARVLLTTNGGKSWDEVYNDASADSIARSVAFDPADPNTVAVGLTSGNLILSRDGGSTWSLVQNFQDQVTQLVWHPNRTLFILIRSKGVYKSTDQAKTVQPLSEPLMDFVKWRERLQTTISGVDPVTAPASLDLPAQQTSIFYKLAVGDNPNTLFVGANNGLFTSADGGQNWTYLKLPLRNAQSTDVRGLALVSSPTAIVYASVGNTVYKTVNGGVSWQVTAIATDATINYILVDPAFPSVAYTGFVGTR